MSLIAISATLLFTAAGIGGFAVLLQAYARAFSAYAETRQALKNSPTSRDVSYRVIEHRPMPKLRLVKSGDLPCPATGLNGLREAA